VTTTPDPDPHRPRCRLTGTGENAVAVCGAVQRAPQNAGQIDHAREFIEQAWAGQSYDEVLELATEYVDVR